MFYIRIVKPLHIFLVTLRYNLLPCGIKTFFEYFWLKQKNYNL